MVYRREVLFITVRETKLIKCFQLHISADYFYRTQYNFLWRTEAAFFCLLHLVLIMLCCVASSLLSDLSFYVHLVPLDKETRFVARSIYLQHPDSCGFLTSALVLGGEEKLIPMG